MRRLAVVTIVVALVTACGANSSGSDGSKLQVVAAENFWGSLAAQLGGDRVEVTSIVASPDVDPHDYEPTPSDGRAIASARYVIFNGLGYDPWAGDAIDANPADHRSVLEVGKLLGLKAGDNPHRWYFPDDVRRVVARITADYQTLDPDNAPYYDAQRKAFETEGLSRYDALLEEIDHLYAGTPVGASESIFVGIADATGLDLITPAPFMTAISEGTDPSADSKKTVDDQITGKQIAVFVYNSQNATPDVQTLLDAARTAGVAVVTITETPPDGVSFQDWQAGQLQALADALERATPT